MQSEQTKPSDLFQCQQCGDCCKGYGGTFVTDPEIEAIAEFIKTDPATFKEKYCKLSGSKPLISQAESGYCIFWNDICTIHPVKPRMCRTWPFIESVVTDTANWYAMATTCPGMKKDIPQDIVKATVERKIKSPNLLP